MQKGRAAAQAKATKKARKEAVRRVKEFRAWLTADAEYREQQRQWIATGKKATAKKPQIPKDGIPSDNDYKIAREEGVLA